MVPDSDLKDLTERVITSPISAQICLEWIKRTAAESVANPFYLQIISILVSLVRGILTSLPALDERCFITFKVLLYVWLYL